MQKIFLEIIKMLILVSYASVNNLLYNSYVASS